MISSPNITYFPHKTCADPASPSDYHQYDSPATTNLGRSLETSELPSPAQICCSPLFFEENEPEDFEIMCLLSPNSKASSLLLRSKRIQKKPVQSKEPLKKKSLSKSGRKRNNWTEDEDEKLLHFMSLYGTRWAKIASHLSNRTGKQVRDRYLSVLIDNINKKPWTEEEDRLILEKLEEIGPQWCRISDCFEGRTDIQVKNRYYTYLKKREKKMAAKADLEEIREEKENEPTEMISYEIFEEENDETRYFNW